jgi:hypothetical protein
MPVVPQANHKSTLWSVLKIVATIIDNNEIFLLYSTLASFAHVLSDKIRHNEENHNAGTVPQ